MASMTISGGLLIAVEGIDGAGKTTLVRAIKDFLEKGGLTVVADKEPTHGPWGEQLRESGKIGRLTPELEMDLMLRDRQQHVDNLISPELKRGSVVILDRYFYSSIAYQGSAGIDPEQIRQANLKFAPEPDLVLLVDVPSEIGLGRVRARGDVPNAFERANTLDAAKAIFIDQLPARPRGVMIDGLQTPGEVFKQALGHVLAACTDKIRQETGVTPASAEKLLRIMQG